MQEAYIRQAATATAQGRASLLGSDAPAAARATDELLIQMDQISSSNAQILGALEDFAKRFSDYAAGPTAEPARSPTANPFLQAFAHRLEVQRSLNERFRAVVEFLDRMS